MSDLLDSWRRLADRELLVSVAAEHGVVVVRPNGEIDSHNAGLLAWTVISSRADGPEVVVDLADVTSIDTAAVRALLICDTRLARESVRFRVRNPQPQVADALARTNTAYLVATELTAA
jgi:anti-anti-sigma factor